MTLARQQRTVRVELDALDPDHAGAHWEHELDLSRQEYKIRFGSREGTDLHLPPAAYRFVAGLHGAIGVLPERTWLELYQLHPRATLDGGPAHDADLAPGPHELVIGDYRFRLTITFT